MSQTTKQKYKARQGDIITLNLNPQAGQEQNGCRPALVVSSDEHNDTTNGSVMVCPITNTKRGWPLHIHLKGTNTTGVVMCDQAKILDIDARQARFVESVPTDILEKSVDTIISIMEADVDEEVPKAHESAHSTHAVIEISDDGTYTAYTPEFLECRASGGSADDALSRLQQKVKQQRKAHESGEYDVYNPHYVGIVEIDIAFPLFIDTCPAMSKPTL